MVSVSTYDAGAYECLRTRCGKFYERRYYHRYSFTKRFRTDKIAADMNQIRIESNREVKVTVAMRLPPPPPCRLRVLIAMGVKYLLQKIDASSSFVSWIGPITDFLISIGLHLYAWKANVNKS